MLWIIFGIGLVFLITGIVFCCIQESFWETDTKIKKFKSWLYHNSFIYWTLNTIGGVVVGATCLAILITGVCYYKDLSTLDSKIEMYQTENAEIETTINYIVEGYKDYEQNVFENSKEGIDPVVLYSMYPELKSNELVNKQIDIYIQNKDTIKELKSQQIDSEVLAWWLYFG